MLAFFILPDKLLYELQRFLLQFITLYDKILVSMLAIIFYETMQDNCFFFQFVLYFGMGNTYANGRKVKCVSITSSVCTVTNIVKSLVSTSDSCLLLRS